MIRQRKKSHWHLTPSEPEAKRAKKKLKVVPSMVSPPLATASTAADLLTPIPSVPVPKDRGKAPAVHQVHRSPHFIAEGGDPREKLMVDVMHAAPIDTC